MNYINISSNKNINKNNIHKESYNEAETENNIINISNIQTEPNIQNKELQ